MGSLLAISVVLNVVLFVSCWNLAAYKDAYLNLRKEAQTFVAELKKVMEESKNENVPK